MKKTCKVCKKEFEAKEADVKRGWSKCCSKSCAASLREKKTGNYKRYLKRQRQRQEEDPTFCNAHQFSNEE